MIHLVSKSEYAIVGRGTVYTMEINPTLTAEQLNEWLGKEVTITTDDKGTSCTGTVKGIEMFLIGGDFPHRSIGILI